jgi:hypothetical protein
METMDKSGKTAHLQKYVDYINNTSLEPLPVEYFDDDHEPIGPMERKQMIAEDLIQVRDDGIYLRPDLVRQR